MCKYHIVFTPKYRRKVIYNQYKSSLGHDVRMKQKFPNNDTDVLLAILMFFYRKTKNNFNLLLKNPNVELQKTLGHL